MKLSRRLLSLAVLAAATVTTDPARAEPLIYDANGVAVASPAGLVGADILRAYLSIDGSVAVVYFINKGPTALLRWWGGSYGALYFRSTDCTGPALIANQEALGTAPSVLLAEGGHAWLHIAEDLEGVDPVKVHSARYAGKQCGGAGGTLKVWKARPPIDLSARFMPPFSIH